MAAQIIGTAGNYCDNSTNYSEYGEENHEWYG